MLSPDRLAGSNSPRLVRIGVSVVIHVERRLRRTAATPSISAAAAAASFPPRGSSEDGGHHRCCCCCCCCCCLGSCCFFFIRRRRLGLGCFSFDFFAHGDKGESGTFHSLPLDRLPVAATAAASPEDEDDDDAAHRVPLTPRWRLDGEAVWTLTVSCAASAAFFCLHFGRPSLDLRAVCRPRLLVATYPPGEEEEDTMNGDDERQGASNACLWQSAAASFVGLLAVSSTREVEGAKVPLRGQKSDQPGGSTTKCGFAPSQKEQKYF
jgi:hypothetical protein